MLDISTVTAEERRKEDLAELFAQSQLRQCAPQYHLASCQYRVSMFCERAAHDAPCSGQQTRSECLRAHRWRHG